VPPGRAGATATSGGAAVLDLSYGDTATVRVTNLGLRRRRPGTPDGYYIDVRSGRWLSESKAAETNATDDELDPVTGAQGAQRVIPYVEDRRNILVARLADTGPAVDAATALSVMYALERGIEAEFQLEDSELSSELLPDDGDRGRALFVESAEGGAGVLRRLVEEPDGLARAARRALRIAHFDPDTGEDTGGMVEGSDERCARACYDCLLSYGNQASHLLIDRHRARDLLLACARSRTTRAGGRAGDPTDVWAPFRLAAEGDPPRQAFVEWLAEREHRPPDEVGVTVGGARPDLVYHRPDGEVAVFVDGPGDADAAGRDENAADDLRDAGWGVVRVPYGSDRAEIVARFRSVFGMSGRERR
jgi:hypothetical protein